jgi:hypothetical protein
MDQQSHRTKEQMDAATQLQAFEGKTPEGQRQVYIQQVTQDAIRTGVEEGYPIRDRATLERHVTEQATPAHVENHITLLRKEAGMPDRGHNTIVGQRSMASEPWGADHKPAWERGADSDVSR